MMEDFLGVSGEESAKARIKRFTDEFKEDKETWREKKEEDGGSEAKRMKM